jgi:uncharacterized protein with ATP-grasp and redox domains
MKTFHDCLPCFVKQALGSLKRTGASEEQIRQAMRAVFRRLATIDFNATPPVTAAAIYRALRTTVAVPDPYARDKERYNELALKMLPGVRATLQSATDPLLCAIKLSIAANIIDFGKNAYLHEKDVLACFESALERTVDLSAVARLRRAIEDARGILYLCDNAGEIVFDRLLIEQLPTEKITACVRGAPVINDATLDDALKAGLDEVVPVIDNGADAPGTVLEDCSPRFRELFSQADLVIAKGQGNFETLSDVSSQCIFFLFQVKCPVIARDSGFPLGSFVIAENDCGECSAMPASQTKAGITHNRPSREGTDK